MRWDKYYLYVFVSNSLITVLKYFIGHGTASILSNNKEIIAVFASKWKYFFLTFQRDLSTKKSGEPGMMVHVCNSYHFEGWVKNITIC